MQRGRIYKKSGSWLVQYRRDEIVGGQLVRKRVAARIAPVDEEHRTPASVRHLAERILSPLNTRTARPQSTDTVLGFLERTYLPHCKATVSPSTSFGYLDVFRRLKPYLPEGLKIADTNVLDVNRLLESMAETGRFSKNTIRNVKSFLSGGFAYAKTTGAIAANPVRDATLPNARTSETVAYSMAEFQAMRDLLDEPAKTVVLTAALSGLRQGEIRGLRWEDMVGNTLQVRRSVWQSHVGGAKTKASAASIPLVPMLKKALEAHRKRNGAGEWIFHGDTGKPLVLANLVKRTIRPAIEEARIIVPTNENPNALLKWSGWHGFRRGLGTLLNDLGVQDKTIQAILRHANVGVTMDYYVKALPETSVTAMQKVENEFKKASRKSMRKK